jgi:hypothetical protein
MMTLIIDSPPEVLKGKDKLLPITSHEGPEKD